MSVHKWFSNSWSCPDITSGIPIQEWPFFIFLKWSWIIELKIVITFKDRTRVKKYLEKKITTQIIMIKENSFKFDISMAIYQNSKVKGPFIQIMFNF